MKAFPNLPAWRLAVAALVPVLLTGCVGTNRAQENATQPPTLTQGQKGHIVLGPYVQPAGPDLSASLRLVWWSDVPGKGQVEWLTGSGPMRKGVVDSSVLAYGGLYRHTVRVDRTPGSAEAFTYVAGISAGGKRFTTARRNASFLPAPGEPLRIVAVGDVGAGTPAQRSVVRQIQKQRPDLVVVTGDIVYDRGDWSEYRRRWFPFYGDLMAATPVVGVLGNHDVGNPDHKGQPYRAAFTPPENGPAAAPYSVLRRRSNRSSGPVPAGESTGRNFSVDAGWTHILCLDSTADRETMEKVIVPWARRDLAEAKRRGSKWLIAAWHHPPYTRGAYRDNSLQWKDIRDLFVPVMREAGVRVVLNGHDHNFQHLEKDGIHYIVTGGGGARLYPVHPEYAGAGQPPLRAWNDNAWSFTLLEQDADGRSLTIRQITADGRKIDEFRIKT